MLASFFALLACAVVRVGTPGPGVVVAPARIGAEAPLASSASLITRIDALLSSVDEIDRRDRLIELRDLISGIGGLDLPARKKVGQYVERALVIEERNRPVPLEESPIEQENLVVITAEEPLGTPPAPFVLAPPVVAPPAVAPPAPMPDSALSPNLIAPPDPLPALHAALAKRDYLGVVAAVDALSELAAKPEAAALRREAVDAWAKSEREAAGAAFLAARELPGAERAAAMKAVVSQLTAINARFPDNSYAAEVTAHLVVVAAEAAK